MTADNKRSLRLRDFDVVTPFALGPRTVTGFKVPVSNAHSEHDAGRDSTIAALPCLLESAFDLVVVSLADPATYAALGSGRAQLSDVSPVLQARLASCVAGIRAAFEGVLTRRIEWGYAVTEETAPGIRVDFSFTNRSMH